MEIALWTAIGTSLGLIAKGVSAEKPVAPNELQARLEALTKELSEAKSKLRNEEREAKARAEAAEQQADAVADVTGVLRKRLKPSAPPPVDITAAATIWSRASADDIRDFAQRQLDALNSAPAAGLPLANTEQPPSNDLVGVVDTSAQQGPPPIQPNAQQEALAAGLPLANTEQPPSNDLVGVVDTSGQPNAQRPPVMGAPANVSSAPEMFKELNRLNEPSASQEQVTQAQPKEKQDGGARGVALSQLFTGLRDNFFNHNPVTRSSLTKFHAEYVNAWKQDNPGQELPAEETLGSFANRVAEELQQIPIDRAKKRDAETRQKHIEMEEAMARMREQEIAQRRAAEEAKRIWDENEPVRRKIEAVNERWDTLYTLIRKLRETKDTSTKSADIADAILRASDYLIDPNYDAELTKIRMATGPIQITPAEYNALIFLYPDESGQWIEDKATRSDPTNGPYWDGYEDAMTYTIGWSSENHKSGPPRRPRPQGSVELTVDTYDAIKDDVDALIIEIQDLLGAVEKEKAVASFYAPREAEVRREKGFTDTQEIDTFIRKQAPDVIKRGEDALKKLAGADKALTKATKLIPKPEMFKGGCLLVTVTAKAFMDGIFDITASLNENLETLKASFKEYEKETKGVKIFDKSFQISDAEMKEKLNALVLASDKKKEDEGRQWLLNWARGTLPPRPPSSVPPPPPPPPPPLPQRGGDDQEGGAFQKLIDLKFKIDNAILKVREDIRKGAELVMDSVTVVQRLDDLKKQEVLTPDQQLREVRDCKTFKEEIEKQPAPKGVAQQRGLDVFSPKKGLSTAVPIPAPNEEEPTPQQTAAINALREQIPLVKEETARTLGRRPSEMYVANPPINDQRTTGEANTSPFFQGVQEVQNWFNTVWAFATKEDRARLETQRTEAMRTLEEAMTPSQRKRARKNLAEKRAKKIGGADEALTEEQKLAEQLYIKLLNEEPTGGSRKRTLKNRRGGKQTQNGRGTRRGKNRTDRTHPNSRRRT